MIAVVAERAWFVLNNPQQLPLVTVATGVLDGKQHHTPLLSHPQGDVEFLNPHVTRIAIMVIAHVRHVPPVEVFLPIESHRAAIASEDPSRIFVTPLTAGTNVDQRTPSVAEQQVHFVDYTVHLAHMAGAGEEHPVVPHIPVALFHRHPHPGRLLITPVTFHGVVHRRQGRYTHPNTTSPPCASASQINAST